MHHNGGMVVKYPGCFLDLTRVEPREIQETTWVFDDHAAIVVQRAVRLRHELALDWPGIAVALTLMDDIAHLKQENRLLRQRLSRFVAHP